MSRTRNITSLSPPIIVAVLMAAPVWAELNLPVTILTATDATIGDTLGQAVDIDGNIALAGANRTDEAGSNSGSAYLFDVSTGEELFKLTASDADARDLFGHSLGIDGNRAVVSGMANDDDGDQSGSVYVFDVTTGAELWKLTASDAAEGDYFGHGLDISGNKAIVGSYHDVHDGVKSGSAYIFDVNTGQELLKLTPSDGASGDWFGYWAAIDGNIAIVGARRSDGGGLDSGSAYLYDVTTGEELMKLTASDAGAGDQFGAAVKIEGNFAIVGAYLNDGEGHNAGSAYVFDVTTGEELYRFSAPDAEPFDEFGRAVGISGYTVMISSENDDEQGSNSGSTYIYDLTFGDLLGKVQPSDGAAGDQFSTAVEISGNVALSGAWLHDNEFDDVGQAYAYDISALLPPGADFNNDDVVDDADLALWESSSPIPRLDVNHDNQVDGFDFLLWQRGYQPEILLDDSPANLDNQGPVDTDDILIWEQSYGVDDNADLDSDGDSDGLDFLSLQREFTPYDAADENRDRKVDGLDLDFWNSSYGWDADIDNDGHLDGDADGDGLVTARDFLWWQKHTTSPALATTSVQVPEPCSCLLLSVLLVASVIRYRQK